MKDNTSANGGIIKWKARALLNGPTEKSIKEIIKMIKKKDMACSSGITTFLSVLGQMEASIAEIGRTASNTAKANLKELTLKYGGLESGKMESVLNGFPKNKFLLLNLIYLIIIIRLKFITFNLMRFHCIFFRRK